MNKKEETKKFKDIHITLDKELFDMLKAYINKTGRARSEIIRDALRKFLTKSK